MNISQNQEKHTSPSKTPPKLQAIKNIKTHSKQNYVVNYLLNQIQFFKDRCYESEDTIARKLGCSVSTVVKAIRIARQSGLVIRRRRFNQSNVYRLNPLCRTESFIDEFAAQLPALRNLLCLSFLMPTMAWLKPATDHTMPENYRLYYKRSYLLNPDPVPEPVSLCTMQALNVEVYPTKPIPDRTGSGCRTINEERDKNLKREVCNPSNNERATYMKYDFLQKNAQYAADMLGLSKTGAAKIAMYDEATHGYAAKVYLRAAKVRCNEITDPVRYYASLCNKYCRENKIVVDYGAENRILMQHTIDREAEIYLPPDQRVRVEMPADKPQKVEGNPYRPVVNEWKKPANAFQFTAAGPIDDIAEAIKMVAYVASGIQGPLTMSLPTAESFIERAHLKISDMIIDNKIPDFDIGVIIDTVDRFIDYTMAKHKDKPHIQMISSAQDAKMKAHQAIADFVPQLLKPFTEKSRECYL